MVKLTDTFSQDLLSIWVFQIKQVILFKKIKESVVSDHLLQCTIDFYNLDVFTISDTLLTLTK